MAVEDKIAALALKGEVHMNRRMCVIGSIAVVLSACFAGGCATDEDEWDAWYEDEWAGWYENGTCYGENSDGKTVEMPSVEIPCEKQSLILPRRRGHMHYAEILSDFNKINSNSIGLT
jgi:hypothetical protein